ncbi:serine/threonine-protein phosphatase [Pseudomonas kairouanensis]|uniref:Serine/threonine-protein phosphatase n=1 Tax=Pseudomonas kairouanensis TaxID=2293832 RepID=A0A4Z0APB0_9PSED|nr:PP2C family serine/threonine-protein phosphatase [Pseudomonas kairouanensis]TFY88626.1 serine/threonine-protein phosphatase [Pseudomonas kairouanensis]
MSERLSSLLLDELFSVDWNQPKMQHIDDLKLTMGSHLGLVRKRNEDRVASAKIRAANGQTYFAGIVCDGVGGSEFGDIAASIAIATFFSELARTKVAISTYDLTPHLLRKMDDAVRAELKGKGTTTASVILASSNREFVSANIGDSRIYSHGNGPTDFKQLSTDDTLENELKRLSIGDASALNAKGLLGSLSQALGESSRSSKDLKVRAQNNNPKVPGLLLASDGAWKVDSIGFDSIIANSKSGLDSAKRVIAFSNWVGGVDNTSILIIEDCQLIMDTCQKDAHSATGDVKITAWFGETKLIICEQTIFTSSSMEKNKVANDAQQKTKPKRSSPRNKKEASTTKEQIKPEQFKLESMQSSRSRAERPKAEISVDSTQPED